MHANSVSIGDITRSENLKSLFPLLCKDCSFCGAIGNNASRVSVVDVCRGSLVRAQVGARRGMEAIPLHTQSVPVFKFHASENQESTLT